MKPRSDLEELFFTVFIPALVITVIVILICCAPSLDRIIWGR